MQGYVPKINFVLTIFVYSFFSISYFVANLMVVLYEYIKQIILQFPKIPNTKYVNKNVCRLYINYIIEHKCHIMLLF